MEKMKPIKILICSNATNNNILICNEQDIDHEGMALFQASDYLSLFGKRKSQTNQKLQRLSVVKITYGSRSIYRQFAARSIDGLNKGVVGLTLNSWMQLGLQNNQQEVQVKKSWWFPFYWSHPNSATRISFILGLVSVALAILGIVISLISILS